MDFLWWIPVALTLLLGVPPLWMAWRDHRTHIRRVWARIETVWEFETLEQATANGSRLVITNGSDWPIWNVRVEEPLMLLTDFDSIGPHERVEVPINEPVASQIFANHVSLRLDDVRHNQWAWTPETQTIKRIGGFNHPIAWLTLRVVERWMDPDKVIDWIIQRPRWVSYVLWGWDLREYRSEPRPHADG